MTKYERRTTNFVNRHFVISYLGDTPAKSLLTISSFFIVTGFVTKRRFEHIESLVPYITHCHCVGLYDQTLMYQGWRQSR